MTFRLTAVNVLVAGAMAAYLAAGAAFVARRRRPAGAGGPREPAPGTAPGTEIPGWLIYGLGSVLCLAAFAVRWVQTTHVPMQNLYEVFLVMGVLMLPMSLFCRRALGVRGEAADALLGAAVLFPVAFVFNPDPQRLPPALQSPLFVPHVAVYMAAYVVLGKGCVQALGAWSVRTRLALAVLVVGRVALAAYLGLASGAGHDPSYGPYGPLWLVLGWVFLPGTTLGYDAALRFVGGAAWPALAAGGVLADLGTAIAAAWLIGGAQPLPPDLRHDRERAAHRMVLAGFPLLTLGLVLGAWWARLAWDDFWGWDPKELWSLVSWLGFLGYLHFRGRYGGRYARVNAALVVLGTVFILLTLLWANLSKIFAGLHSYA